MKITTMFLCKILMINIFLFSSSLFAKELELSIQEKEWIKANPIVNVGVFSFSPYQMLENDNFTGYHVELFDAVLSHVGLKSKHSFGLWQKLFQDIKDDKLDVVLSLIKNEERAKALLFPSHEVKVHQAVFAYENRDDITTLESLKGKTLATYPKHGFRSKLFELFPESKIIDAKDKEDMFHLVYAGKADACILEVNAGLYTIQNNFLTKLVAKFMLNIPNLTPIPGYEFAVRKTNPTLYSILNKAYMNLPQNIKSQIWKKWFGQSKTAVNLTHEEQEYLNKKSYLSVMSLENFKPFSFTVNDESRGYSVEAMKLIGELLNKEIRFVKKTWKEQLDMLKRGELDIIPHIAITEERKKYVDYTDFIHISFLIGIATNEKNSINSMKDLSGKKVAIVEGYYFQKHLERTFPDIKLVTFKATQEAINAVAKGEAYAAIDSMPALNYIIEDKWLTNLKVVSINDFGMPIETKLPMGVKKGNHHLKSILEKVHAVLSKEELKRLKHIWIGSLSQDKKTLNQKELEFIKKHPVVRFRVRSTLAPYEFVKDKKPTGIAVDYIKAISKKVGLQASFIVDDKTVSEAIEDIKSERKYYDTLLFSVATKEREKELTFGSTYLAHPLMIATKRGAGYIGKMSDLNGKKLVIEKGFATNEWVKRDYPLIKIVNADNIQEALELLIDEKADAYIGNMAILNYMIHYQGMDNIQIAAPSGYDNVKFSFVAPKELSELSSILSKGFLQLSQEEHQEIQQKWFSLHTIEKINYQLIWQIVFTALFIIFWIVWWNRKIHSEKLKIQSLNEKLDDANTKMEKYIELIDENILMSSTDLKGNIVEASDAFCKMSGYTKDELIGEKHNIVKHEDMDKSTFNELWVAIKEGKTWQGEIKNKKKNGEFYWINTIISPVYDKDKNIIKFTSLSHDITDKKIIEEISITDEMTGLYNRRYYKKVFENEMNRIKRNDSTLVYMMMDVDFFKRYNDTYGHQEGDNVLKQISNVLQDTIKRAGDYCFRMGGEEFLVFLSDSSLEGAKQIAEQIRTKVESLKIEHRGNEASSYVTISIGMTVTKAKDVLIDEESLYKTADDALYRAKELGRNQVFIHEGDGDIELF